MGIANDIDHWFAHTVSIGAIVGAIRGDLPEIAAVVALSWYVLQIWESRTVQSWRLTRKAISTWDHLTKAQAATLLAQKEISAAQGSEEAKQPPAVPEPQE
jgi:hypothetical protein